MDNVVAVPLDKIKLGIGKLFVEHGLSSIDIRHISIDERIVNQFDRLSWQRNIEQDIYRSAD